MTSATRRISVKHGMVLVDMPWADTTFARSFATDKEQLSTAIYSLACNPLLVDMAREMVMLGMSTDVAEARLFASGTGMTPKLLSNGQTIATLIVHAVDSDSVVDSSLFDNAIPTGATAMRDILLATCAVIDPTSSLLLECTNPSAFHQVDLPSDHIRNIPLDVLLSGEPEARFIEVVVPHESHFRIHEIAIGKSMYRVSHAIAGHTLYRATKRDDDTLRPIKTSNTGVVAIPNFTPTGSKYHALIGPHRLFLVRK